MVKRPLIALFGGTFDPIHLGHLRSAEELRQVLQADELRLLPCHRPPHRANPGVSSEHRLAMAKLAIANSPGLSIDDRELKRDKLSFTVDTLEDIRRECGSEPTLCWVMGADAFSHLASWYRWEELLTFAHIIVIARPEAELPTQGAVAALLEKKRLASVEELHQQAAGGILLQELTAYSISATEVRKALKTGERPVEWLPANVLDYIDKHQLYQK